MRASIRTRRGHMEIRENMVDRVVGYFSPVTAQRRFRARAQMAIAGGYVGASRAKRSLKGWSTRQGSADSDTLFDLGTLRSRSRDLIRNTPLATGAINTVSTNVVGTGLKLQSRIDRDVLSLTDEKADAWEAKTEREWRLFSESQECDAARTLRFAEIQALVFRQTLENGDVFVVLPRFERPGSPYSLRLQTIEADRVCNEKYQADTNELAGGIKKDGNGAPVEYQILTGHPGNLMRVKGLEWEKIRAFGAKTGERNVLHLFTTLRPGQSRGVPYLAPVIESLKQLDRYTEAELMAAVVSGLFTIFIKTESGDTTLDLDDLADETGAKSSDTDYKLGNGAIISLARDEDIQSANPTRPNAAFDPFVISILRQIGVALEIPYEILVKHFTSSYSAARAALLEAWKFFNARRYWLASNCCQPVYEAWLREAVAMGRIGAPGFFTDPIIRKAYCGAEWVGPAKGMIDEYKEVQAAEKRIDLGVSTLSEVTAEMTGGDWEKKHPQTVKEHEARKKAGLTEKRTPEKLGTEAGKKEDTVDKEDKEDEEE